MVGLVQGIRKRRSKVHAKDSGLINEEYVDFTELEEPLE